MWLAPKPLSDPTGRRGFTIVELLIVIVVIGILATIVIVAYGGIQQRAHLATLQSDLSGAAEQLGVDNVTTGSYPATAAASNNGLGLKASPGTTWQYTYTSSSGSYCLTGTNNGVSYFVSSANNVPQAGACPGDVNGGGGGGGNTFTTLTWTQQTAAGSRNWFGVASSADGSKLVAGDYRGYLYTGVYQ
jgi:prepilin-type N-terminal cleavage/methylation domain-containing protein